MKVVFYKKDTDEVVNEFDNVDEIGENYIFLNNYTGKIYCAEDEYIKKID